MAYRPLTVAFHAAGFAERLNAEGALGLPFQQDSRTRQQAGSPNGPAQPQSLNRYSYVLNNPEKWTDPSGHSVYLTNEEAIAYEREVRSLAREMADAAIFLTIAEAAGGGMTAILKDLVNKYPVVGQILGTLAASVALLAVTAALISIDLYNLADAIRDMNSGSGVILMAENAGPRSQYAVFDRSSGNGLVLDVSWPASIVLQSSTVGRGKVIGRGADWRPGSACTSHGKNVSGPRLGGDTLSCIEGRYR